MPIPLPGYGWGEPGHQFRDGVAVALARTHSSGAASTEACARGTARARASLLLMATKVAQSVGPYWVARVHSSPSRCSPLSLPSTKATYHVARKPYHHHECQYERTYQQRAHWRQQPGLQHRCAQPFLQHSGGEPHAAKVEQKQKGHSPPSPEPTNVDHRAEVLHDQHRNRAHKTHRTPPTPNPTMCQGGHRRPGRPPSASR